jgi:hypothetical protein
MDAAEELLVPLSGLPLPSVVGRSGSNKESNDMSEILLP